jgi:hypothetical protein
MKVMEKPSGGYLKIEPSFPTRARQDVSKPPYWRPEDVG